jgi:leucyl/phenylalanyl-tRNA--protein transferase
VNDLVDVTTNLTLRNVEAAYRRGIFPMGSYKPGYFTWHKPSPRAVLPLDRFHISKSLATALRKHDYTVTYDQAFQKVMEACADRPGIWITSDVINIYSQLHAQGKAHSVEIWQAGELAGGVYGVHLGAAFFAESKFHRGTNMSKVALAELVFRLREREFALLEVQYLTEHLKQFGVIEISDAEYQRQLVQALATQRKFI